mmetsp:Transcript_26413/g.67426  ORF Transcript_26413/g.67426 Transcript_26413/m.67426 type:complete len:114 (+) Transcript_26413:721-1062(+)
MRFASCASQFLIKLLQVVILVRDVTISETGIEQSINQTLDAILKRLFVEEDDDPAKQAHFIETLKSSVVTIILPHPDLLENQEEWKKLIQEKRQCLDALTVSVALGDMLFFQR